MRHYSIEPKDRIFVEGYGLFILLSGKYNQKVIDHAKQSATDASIRAIENSRRKWRFNW